MPAATCPHCRQSVSVPAGVVQARCSACGQVFSPAKSAPAPAPAATAASTPRPEAVPARSGPPAAIIAAGVAVFLLLSAVALGGIVYVSRARSATRDAAAAQAKADQIARSRAAAATFEVVDVPEPRRREIYAMVRQSAKSSVERSLPAPKGSKLESTLTDLTTGVHEYSQSQIAALQDVTREQIDQIMLEGKAKGWPQR